MAQPSYKQFCPVAMASEILCTRWTLILLRELMAGSTRFNDLRRGVSTMSPTLLSQRLKELEESGVLERVAIESEPSVYEYVLTEAGRDLQLVINTVGHWGQKWVESRLSLRNLDPSLLMWDMRRNLDIKSFPKDKYVIHFLFHELPLSKKNWWLVIKKNEEVDLCWTAPDLDVDLTVTTSVKTMTAIWMGVETVIQALKEETMKLDGDKELINTMQKWLGLSPFAATERRVP
jgi:DNA-binding HxlR family transcriptional regulator